MRMIGEHAAVLGASMAGMMGARVLADAYERVTVLERDQLPESGEPRKGVPQGRHAHALLADRTWNVSFGPGCERYRMWPFMMAVRPLD